MSSNKDLRQSGVWEEAGGEFYQENYNKNRRISTLNRIPLPSQTARRNSAWKTGSNIYTHRRGTTRTIDYNIIDGIPDLSDESLGNEKTMFYQRKSFKNMPISMAEKRALKTQLNTNPVLKLTGWNAFKWRLERLFDGMFSPFRNIFKFKFFQRELRGIQSRFGHVFTTYFEEVKTLLLLSYFTGILCLGYRVFMVVKDKPELVTNTTVLQKRVTNISKSVSDQGPVSVFFGRDSPLFYSFYDGTYDHDGSFLVFGVGLYFLVSVLHVVYQFWRHVHERIGQRYLQNDYSDLIFSGWDHFTNCKSGSEFKKGAVQGKIQASLFVEAHARQNTLGVVGIRTCVSVIIMGLVSICLLFTWHLLQFCHSHTSRVFGRDYNAAELTLCFLPQIFICVCWSVLSVTMERMGKWEKYECNERVSVLILRCWSIRAMFLALFLIKVYLMLYSAYQPDENAPVASSVTVIRVDTYEIDENYCWETAFAKEIYKFLIVDLGLKIFMAFIVEPIRALIGKVCPIGSVHFHIVSSYFDLLSIHLLALVGTYFSPLLPLVVGTYTWLLFLVKTFGLLVNCRGSPDIYKSMRSAIIKAKVITYVISACLIIFVVTFMKPSPTCGPFKEYETSWGYVSSTVVTKITDEFLPYIKCPTWSLPLVVVFLFATLYYKYLTHKSERMIGALRHLLVLEGHDKQFLFRRVEAMQSNT